MYSLLENYINNISITQIKDYALTKAIELDDNELNFIYAFIKKNWQTIFANHGNFDISRYKTQFSETNYPKIVSLYKEALQKYSRYL